MAQRRKFSKEFKLEAVNLVIARGVSLAQASRDLACAAKKSFFKKCEAVATAKCEFADGEKKQQRFLPNQSSTIQAVNHRRKIMKLKRTLPLLIFALLGLAQSALAQKWPTQPLKIIVSFAAGGAADQLARAIAPQLSEVLGQPVVIDNKSGAGGNIGADLVAKSPADGHTLLLGSGGIFSINPHIYKNMPFDPAKDLVPVASVGIVPQYLVVRSDGGITSLEGLISDLKANPNKRSYGSPGVGTSGHMASAMLLGDIQSQATHVPYRGGAPALNDLLAGQLNFIFDSGASLQHVKAGKLRLLGIGSPNRSPAVPNTPTLEELGLKGFNADTVFGLYTPAGTPQSVINRINSEVNRILASGPAKDRILANGQIPFPQSPEQFAKGTENDFKRYGSLIRTHNISAQ
ncbi:MAG: tripartite tricarboxylate transporter substrate-binding protein [Hylemonella sp.]